MGAKSSTNMKACEFDRVFTKNVPHITEKIFLCLDYESLKVCFKVNSKWNEMLKSDSFKKKAKVVFSKEILKNGTQDY